MPARPAVPQVVQIVTGFHWAEDIHVINRFYQKYSTPGPLSDSGALAWANGVATAWNTHIAAEIATDCVLEYVEVTDLSSSTGAQQTAEVSHAGTNSNQSVSAGACLVIQSKIERRYRGGHPRQYLPGMTVAALADPQTWLSPIVSGMATAYTAFRADCAAAAPSGLLPVTDVNVSYYEGFTNHTYPSGRVRPIPNLRGTPLVDQIAEFVVNPKVGSQRRRNLQTS